MQVACPDCRGDGVHADPGMRHGEQVTFPERGDQVDPEIEASDVIVVINVKEHAVFKRNGDNLHMVKEISLNEALFGTWGYCPTR
ncbi:unnamed protein product, partial [Mesorhabditis belari]|uniref:Chaperone DnaJ C-terminal domain-containing protein n=1 Tax=Mesorhabditis belari TaxID=2138241 RepID=A0AAF3J3H6_9BILA